MTALVRTLRAQAIVALRNQLEADYSPGDRLPPEATLAKRMGLSRNTLREAVSQLVSEGRLDRRWGVGTIVLSPRPLAAFSVNDMGPIQRIIEASGRTPSLARCASDVTAAPDEAAEQLGLPRSTPAISIERLYAVDDVPAVLLSDWCPTRIDDIELDVTSLHDMGTELPDLLREQTGVVLHRLEGRIDAVPRVDEFALSDARRGPLVQITQTVVTRDSRPVVFSTIQFDTSVVDLTISRVFGWPS